MADWLRITGVKPYDGRYPWKIAAMEYTTREWIWIKQYAKVYPDDYFDELRKLDAALVTILAVIMMRRAGAIDAADVQTVWDRFQDVEYGSHLQVEADEPDMEEEGDADGPPTRKLLLEWRLLWDRFDDRFGALDGDPARIWQPALGFFGVRAGDVGELTPVQMLACADLFEQIAGMRAGVG